MSRMLSSLLLVVAFAGPAMAVGVPAPEVDGGILGLVFAAGLVYFVAHRGRSGS